MPPSTSQVKVISPRNRRDTRDHIAFDEECGGSFMDDTFLRYYSSLHFLWLVPNFRFIMVTFPPFLVYLFISLGLVAQNTYYTCLF